MEFLSHAEIDNKEITYKKLLKDHLSEVASNIREKIKEVYKDDVLAEAGYIVGVSHDFGKYTTYFQDYLLTGKSKSNLEWHGFISAVFAAYLMENIKSEGKIYSYLPLLSYFAVLHHHGNLYSFDSDVVPIQKLSSKNFELVDTRMRDKLLLVEPQLENILEHRAIVESEYREIFDDVNLEHFKEKWVQTLKGLYKQKYNLQKENDDFKLKLNTLLLFMYSCLIDNDKRDAANVRKVKRRHIPGDLVDRYRRDKFDVYETQGIYGIRNEIYDKVVKKISEVPLDNQIFTLTAPTGTGKTITSFSAALKLRERLKQINNFEPRIIYALPFTSIIDQNFDVIENILSYLDDFRENKNAYMIKHHHLADISYLVDDEARPLDESLLLVESWDSEVVVTTFIQLFYTIIGYKNRFLKKYHNIANSIILLDEVQNIPMEYWPLVNTMLKHLADELNCYIILLTATKPLIFNEDEAIELLDGNQEYFKKFNRVVLKPNLEEMGVEEFVQKFLEVYEREKSYLVVLNTIKSSVEFYEKIKDELQKQKVKIFYLSTNIIPKDRKKRIEEIKAALGNHEKVVVVSTQVVEAGVDIDLDVVLRDLGTVDSVVQVAGRCNREWDSGKTGEVYIFNLRDKIHYSSKIYGSISCRVSADLLKKDLLKESEFYQLIADYFDFVKMMKGIQEESDESRKILDAIYNFRFDDDLGMYDSVSHFKLIQDSNYVDVFVQADIEAVSIWERYKNEVLNEKNFKKRQENYLMIKREFRSYIISVPQKSAKEFIHPTENSSILLLPYENIKDYYNDETGFNRNLENLITMM